VEKERQEKRRKKWRMRSILRGPGGTGRSLSTCMLWVCQWGDTVEALSRYTSKENGC